ncbi:MAG: hypothetical protein QOD49_2474, partial [Actinomycetota bacterium]|nr:hypothetical protein [Actinomycetota bacterium]
VATVGVGVGVGLAAAVGVVVAVGRTTALGGTVGLQALPASMTTTRTASLARLTEI